MPSSYRNDGFTLIELIVVIALVAVLAAVVAPNLLGKASEANRKAALVQLEKISSAVELYRLETGQYPEDLIDLNPYNTVPTLVDRDLALYDSRIICEYLDERFPHPPLRVNKLPAYTLTCFSASPASSTPNAGRRQSSGAILASTTAIRC